MMTLGIVLLVSTLTGSYGLAGQVSAAYIIGNAVVAIPHGRLADRFGQGRVLYVDAVAFALTTGADDRLDHRGLGAAVAAPAGRAGRRRDPADRLAGAGPLGAPARRRPASGTPPSRPRASPTRSSSSPGPALVTFLSTVVRAAGRAASRPWSSARSAPSALAVQRRTEPPAHPHDPATARDPMPWGLLVPLTVGAVALGSLFGALEVATVAFADDAGHKALSGLMLGAFSLGSLLAGVVAGAMTWRRGPLRAGPDRHGPARASGTAVAAVPAGPGGRRRSPCS